MLLKAIPIIVTLLCSFNSLATTKNVVGLDLMTAIYQQTIAINSSDTPPMPKVYIYDNKKQVFVSKVETFKLLNIQNQEQHKSFISFIGNTHNKPIKVANPSVIQDSFKINKKRYIALYFNMPSDSLEPLLTVMPNFSVLHTKVLNTLTQNNNVVLFKTFL